MINKTMKSILILSFIFASTTIFANGEEEDSSDDKPKPDMECQPFPECTRHELDAINNEFSIWSTTEIKSIAHLKEGTEKTSSSK